MYTKRSLLKIFAIAVLLSLIFVGIFGKQNARAAGKQTFTVMVGKSTDVGADILAFAPQTLKVHRGDSVTWKFSPVHNVHFVAQPVDQIVPMTIDGKDALVLNPVIIIPNAQTGDSAKPGMNTGLLGDPSGPTDFTGVIDLAPGTYTYLSPGPALIPSGKSDDEFTGQELSSGLLNPTQSFELKFPKAGVYKYYCGIHPGHIGTIVVLPKS